MGGSKPFDRPPFLLGYLPVGANSPDGVDGHLGRQTQMDSGFLVNQGLNGNPFSLFATILRQIS